MDVAGSDVQEVWDDPSVRDFRMSSCGFFVCTRFADRFDDQTRLRDRVVPAFERPACVRDRERPEALSKFCGRGTEGPRLGKGSLIEVVTDGQCLAFPTEPAGRRSSSARSGLDHADDLQAAWHRIQRLKRSVYHSDWW